MTEPIRWAEFTNRECHIATELSRLFARIRRYWEDGATAMNLEEVRRWAKRIADASERPDLVTGFFNDDDALPRDDGTFFPPPAMVVHDIADDSRPPAEMVQKAWGPKGVRALLPGGENER